MKPLEFLALYSDQLYKMPKEYEVLLNPEKHLASLGIDEANFKKFDKKIQDAILDLVRIKEDLNFQIKEFSSGSHSEEISKEFGGIFGSNSLLNLSYSAHGTKVLKNDEEEGVDLALIIILGAIAVFVAKIGFYFFKRKKTKNQLEKAIKDIKTAALILSDGEIEDLQYAQDLILELQGDYVALDYVKDRVWI